MNLSSALQRLHEDDGQAAQVVLDTLQRLASTLARKQGVNLDLMQDFASKVMLGLLERPTPDAKDRPEAFLAVCLLNEVRSWKRSKASKVRSLGGPEDDQEGGLAGALPAWTVMGDPREACGGAFAGRSVVAELEEREAWAMLASTIERTRVLAGAWLGPTDAQAIGGLIEICLRRTSADAEAERLGIAKNALQARQTRARRHMLAKVEKALTEAAAAEVEQLRCVGRLVEALRERTNA